MVPMQVVFIGTSVLLVWLGVGWGLRPLEALRTAIARRDHSDLEPLSLRGLPSELRGQAKAINELMARLRVVLDGERRFLADATHGATNPDGPRAARDRFRLAQGARPADGRGVRAAHAAREPAVAPEPRRGGLGRRRRERAPRSHARARRGARASRARGAREAADLGALRQRQAALAARQFADARGDGRESRRQRGPLLAAELAHRGRGARLG
jgi:hypothetical protein